jgi:hypothetical protein
VINSSRSFFLFDFVALGDSSCFQSLLMMAMLLVVSLNFGVFGCADASSNSEDVVCFLLYIFFQVVCKCQFDCKLKQRTSFPFLK